MDQEFHSERPQDGVTGAYADDAIAFATSLLENAQDLFAVIDFDLRFVGLNAAFRREFELVFGCPVEVGQHIDDALAHLTGDRDKAINLCRRALGGESFRVIEEFGDEQLLRKTYELAFNPILDTTRRPVMAVVVVRDLTMQRLSERRFAELLEAAPDAMIIVRADGIIDLANAHTARMFRYERAQLTGLSVDCLLPERFRSQHRAHRAQFIQQAVARPMGQGRSPLLGLRADGSEFPVEISLNPMTVGGETLVVGAIRDMTLRQASEDRLRELSASLEQQVAERAAALEQAYDEYRVTFDQAAVGIVHLSVPERRFLRVNPAFCQMVGYEPDELLAMTVSDLTHPDDLHAYDEQYAQMIAGQLANFVMEKRYLRKDGAVIWMRKTFSAVRDRHGAVLYGISVVEDITAAKQADLERREATNRLQLAVTIANLGLWEWDVAASEIHLSAQWKAQLGYRDHELSITTEEWLALLHPEDQDRIRLLLAEWLAHPREEVRLEYRMRHRDGGYRSMVANAILITSPSKEVSKLIGTQLDVTDTKLAEKRLLEAAQHDPLTGLPNRALVFEYASHLLAAVRRDPHLGAFLFIDLDRFKPINDLYGHGVGDRLLQEVAKRLQSCVRDEDLVGRLGGDEFVILLSHIRGQRATTVARHVLNGLARPFALDGQDFSISASIGISYFPEHGTDIDALIHAADLAMYQAKQVGRANYSVYAPGLSTRADATSSIEAQLKRALKCGGLALHYQPVIDMGSRRVIGAEALLRLTVDGHSTIGPADFIPVAETAGLIWEMGEWVAIEACRQHRAWREQGLPPIPIAINVSPVQFRQRSFAQRLQSILQEAHMEPDYFQIEVTESAVMDSVDDAIGILNHIKSMGIKIALDDFGTGYSSLSHLSNLPLDKLKVDQSFVKRLGHDLTSRAITGAIITLGRTLKLEVVGEGIETASTFSYLQENGCDQAQGFYFSQPLPAPDFAHWIRAGAAGGNRNG